MGFRNFQRVLATAVLLCVIGAGVAWANPMDSVPVLRPPFIEFGIKEGLPSLFVTHLYQDARGVMWISTSHGVCNFDGRTINRITSNGLMDDFVLCVQEDPEGNLWCLTIEARLYMLRDRGWVAHPQNESLNQLVRGRGVIGRLGFDGSGNIYLDDRLRTMKVSADTVEIWSENKDVTHVNLSQVGNQLLGVVPYMDAGRADRTVTVELEQGVVTFKDPQIDIEGVDKQVFSTVNNGWAGYARGMSVYQFSDGELHYSHIPSNPTNSLTFDDQGNLWVGTERSGAIAFADGQPIAQIFQMEKVTSVFQDFEGGYWFGFFDKGLRYVPSLKATHHALSPKITGDIALHNYGNHFYVIDDHGRVHRDMNVTSLEPVWPGIWKTFPVAYKQDELIITPFSTTEPAPRVIVYDLLANTKKVVQTRMISRVISISGQDTLVCGNGYIDFGLEKPITTCFFRLPIREIIHLARDTLLFVTDRGISEVGLNRDSSITLNPTNWLADSVRFTHGVRMADQVLCLAPGKPPYTYDIQTRILRAHGQSPFPNPRAVVSLNSDSVFVGTDQGLLLLTKSTTGNISFFNLTNALGMIKNRVNDLVISGDSLYMALPDGIQRIGLRLLKKARPAFGKLTLTDVQLNEKSVSLTNLPNPYVTDHLRFLVKAVSFKMRDDFRYEYRLLPIDTQWTQSIQPYIDFYRLPSDDYILQLKNGPNIRETTFSVRRHFYQQPWFLVCIIMLITGILLLPVYLHQRLKHTRLRLQREKDQLQLQSLTYQLKPHFVFNALSSIQSFILDNDPLKSSEYLSQFAQHIRNALTSSARGSVSLEQVVVSTRNYLELETMRLNGSFDFDIQVDPHIDASRVNMPIMLLQPYVENAVIHGMTNIDYQGRIDIRFSLDSARMIRCTIIDNGAGLDRDNSAVAHRGNGLGTSINRQRIQLINSLHKKQYSVSIQANDKGPGVTVTIFIPITHE